ncbi:FHA domain-containing protein DDL [Quillaja saponaria]|uniref:FHA domain-containing protein DDL n=1 Tax=Quillaja saponaria TaxID=32244 RepID=A0AAD7PQ86_QUISA|nr:FHA domain-containing protein DDL [Quillaja saponaria]
MGRNTSLNHGGRSPPSSLSRRERDRDREREKERDTERSPTRRHRNSHFHRADTSPARDRSSSPPLPPREKHHHLSRGSAKTIKEVSGSPPPRSRSPSLRTKRLRRPLTDSGNARNHGSDRGRDRDMVKGSDSPSPPTKRLRGAEADREHEHGNERNHDSGRGIGKDRDHRNERNHDTDMGIGSDRNRGRGSDREIGTERKWKRSSGRDENNDNDNGSSRSSSSKSRLERPTNSPDRHHNGRSRLRSQSPQQPSAASSKASDEVSVQLYRWDLQIRMSDKEIKVMTVTNSRGAEGRNDDSDSVAKMEATQEALEEKQKQKPSFELSGKLAAETNRVKGVTLLFNEPPDARKPDIRWRLYVFKGGEVLNEPLYIHRQSCYLFGRERRVADIPTDHPSCSKQQAVIQFRKVENEQPDGTLSKQTRPYLMDLGSTNKTSMNDSPIEPQRYYELREKDTIKFAENMSCCMKTQLSNCSRARPSTFWDMYVRS